MVVWNRLVVRHGGILRCRHLLGQIDTDVIGGDLIQNTYCQ
jgi:hypothetical protein